MHQMHPKNCCILSLQGGVATSIPSLPTWQQARPSLPAAGTYHEHFWLPCSTSTSLRLINSTTGRTTWLQPPTHCPDAHARSQPCQQALCSTLGTEGSSNLLLIALVYCCIVSILCNNCNLFSSDVEVKELGVGRARRKEQDGGRG